MPADHIHSALSSADSPPHVADALIAAALDHGGPDNVTVMVIDIADQALDGHR